MIDIDSLEKVWFPTQEEYEKKIDEARNKLNNLPEPATEAIQEKYEELDKLFEELRTKGEKFYTREDITFKLGEGYRFLIKKHVKNKTKYELTDNKLARYLKRTEHVSLHTKYAGRDTSWVIANDRAKEQEMKTLNMLKTILTEEEIRYDKPIFYKFKKGKTLIFKRPDFLIIKPDSVIIIECKLYEFPRSENKKQLLDYIILIRKMFPEKTIYPVFVCKNIPENFKHKNVVFESSCIDEWLGEEDAAISYGLVDDNELYRLKNSIEGEYR